MAVLLLLSGLLTQYSFASNLDRSLGFYNLHTEERIKLVYRKNGELVNDSVNKFSHLLRDHRRNETLPIDPKLFDLLYALREKVGSTADFHVVSGYRSAKTNRTLANAGRQVATKSQHIIGRAIDIRLPGVPLETLHQAAVELKLGGVGLYKSNDFIHVDLGRVRYW